uniref:Uncharacterized protein n=1 Tax=Plectus sambesii TaxID=2011161 RepID=A0A914XDS0_9BILA
MTTYFVLVVRRALVLLLVVALHLARSTLRFKRDFMYVPDQPNGTDPDCYQKCNDAWSWDFEAAFNMSSQDFYDFPFHPLILDEAPHQMYCAISAERLRCYTDNCGDTDAYHVWSPSNFLCTFKAALFAQARSCLAATEPLAFDRCDDRCHTSALARVEEQSERALIGQVFSASDEAVYRRELDLLCSFQDCFRNCQQPILADSCDSAGATAAGDLIATYISWHANDVRDWHLSSGKVDGFPDSCKRLQQVTTSSRTKRTVDPIVQLLDDL